MLADDLAHREAFRRVAAQTLRPEASIADSDRDPLDILLRRTAACWPTFAAWAGPPTCGQPPPSWPRSAPRPPESPCRIGPRRRALFDKACHLRRRIALANPLLDFKDILFVKRQRSCFNHMCDQFYGIAQRPGGGLFVLVRCPGPGGERSAISWPIRSWTAGLRRARGPGRAEAKLEPDSRFLRQPPRRGDAGGIVPLPQSVLRRQDRGLRLCRVPRRTHCTSSTATRSGATGTRGDATTCSGRRGRRKSACRSATALGTISIPAGCPAAASAFISERRGGYLRCGRACPTFTVFDMAPRRQRHPLPELTTRPTSGIPASPTTA